MHSVGGVALRSQHATTRSPRYVLGPGADLPIARIVALLLILLPIGALLVINNLVKAPPSDEAAGNEIERYSRAGRPSVER